MPKFRKKPVVIEAKQWNPEKSMESAGDIAMWLKWHAVDFTVNADHSLRIATLEGDHLASIGD